MMDMRSKDFYDKVHMWDMNVEALRKNPDYVETLQRDNTRRFFENFYCWGCEYDLIEFYFNNGVPKDEVVECIAFVHGVDSERCRKIRVGISRRVREEIDNIKQRMFNDMCDRVKSKNDLKDGGDDL